MNDLALHSVEQWSHLYPEVKIIGEVTVPQLMFFGTHHFKYSVYLEDHFVPSSLEKNGVCQLTHLPFLSQCCFKALI